MMKTLSELAEKFEKLLAHLPGAIRNPVEREWRPIKELFIDQRPPRLLAIGISEEAFLQWVGVAAKDEADSVSRSAIHEASGPWLTFHHRGALQFAIGEGAGEGARSAIFATAPDAFLLFGREETDVANLKLLAELHNFDKDRWHEPAPIVGASLLPAAMLAELVKDDDLRPSVAAVVARSDREAILAAVAKALPQEAQLEFARATGEKGVQREIATAVSRSLAAICAAVGAQPIPLADFPILTSLQVLLVGAIIHISGREWRLKTVRDFIAALGINIGAGLALREGARTAAKLLPGWGNAISGAIAGAGTLAIGRAASAFFIEGHSMEEARKQFKSSRKPQLPAK